MTGKRGDLGEVFRFCSALRKVEEKGQEIEELKKDCSEVPGHIQEIAKEYFRASIPHFLKVGFEACEITFEPHYEFGGGVLIKVRLPFSNNFPGGFDGEKFYWDALSQLKVRVPGLTEGFFKIRLQNANYSNFDLGFGCC